MQLAELTVATEHAPYFTAYLDLKTRQYQLLNYFKSFSYHIDW